MNVFRTSWLWLLPPVFGVGVVGGYLGGHPPASGGVESETRIVHQNPSAALPDAKSVTPMPSADIDPSSRLGILERIAAATLDELPALTRELLKSESDYLLENALYDRWAELDPQAGLEFALNASAETHGDAWKYAHSRMLGRWAIRDPEAALAAAKSLVDPQVREKGISAALSQLGAWRPADLFRLLPLLGPDPGRMSSLSDVTRAFALSDPTAACAAIEAMDPERRRYYGLAADLAGGWAKSDPDGALAWARDLDDSDERRRSLRAIAGRLLASDPDRAAAVYKESGSLGEASDGLTIGGDDLHWKTYDWPRLARQLAQTNPEAAVAWVAEHFPEKAGTFLPNLLPQDAVAALEAVARLPDAVLQDGKLQGWPGADWRPVSVEAAVTQLGSIENPVTRESMHAWLLGVQAVADPAGAIAAAMRDLTDPENRAHVLGNGMATWAREDLTGASTWLATRPPGVETDGAIASLVAVAKFTEPEAALVWALAISESENRVSRLSEVYWSWKATDESAASEALGAAALSAAERAALAERGVRFSP